MAGGMVRVETCRPPPASSVTEKSGKASKAFFKASPEEPIGSGGVERSVLVTAEGYTRENAPPLWFSMTGTPLTITLSSAKILERGVPLSKEMFTEICAKFPTMEERLIFQVPPQTPEPLVTLRTCGAKEGRVLSALQTSSPDDAMERGIDDVSKTPPRYTRLREKAPPREENGRIREVEYAICEGSEETDGAGDAKNGSSSVGMGWALSCENVTDQICLSALSNVLFTENDEGASERVEGEALISRS